MKLWLANLLWDALIVFAGKLHDWVFDPQRAARARFKDRQRWWAYKIKAEETKDQRRAARAEWFRIRFNFETSPAAAVQRGDLDAAARKMALDAVERSRAVAEWQGPAADRAKP